METVNTERLEGSPELVFKSEEELLYHLRELERQGLVRIEYDN